MITMMTLDDLENEKMVKGEPPGQKINDKKDMETKQKQGKSRTGNKTQRRTNGKIFSVWHIWIGWNQYLTD